MVQDSRMELPKSSEIALVIHGALCAMGAFVWIAAYVYVFIQALK